jgi:hypothetical protein
MNPLTLLVKYGLIDHDDGTIYDTKTNLTWQQSSSSKEYNLKNAHKYCRKLRLAGHRDWRLPTIEELKTLIEKEHEPAICPVFNCKSNRYWYWSCTSSAGYPGYAWYVGFQHGFVGDYGNKDFSIRYVRAVRTGQ